MPHPITGHDRDLGARERKSHSIPRIAADSLLWRSPKGKETLGGFHFQAIAQQVYDLLVPLADAICQQGGDVAIELHAQNLVG